MGYNIPVIIGLLRMDYFNNNFQKVLGLSTSYFCCKLINLPDAYIILTHTVNNLPLCLYK